MNKQEKEELVNQLNSRLMNYPSDPWVRGHNEGLKSAVIVVSNLPTADELQKVKVPAYVAPFIEKLKTTGRRYGVELERAYESSEDDLSKWLWFNENVLTVFKALEHGYEVEEETKYQVKMGDCFLIKLFKGKRSEYRVVKKDELIAWEKSAYNLTEQEIKSIDERYWPFAVPVEEVAE